MAEWRDIEGFNYRVSDEGEILSLHTNRVMKSHANRADGYMQVGLTKDGRAKSCFVHHLVAAAFIRPRAHRECINHKNGDKRDNRAANLEYCTHKENMDHALVAGLIPSGQRHYLSKFTDTDAKQIIARYEQGGVSMKQLAKERGVAVSTIRRMVRGVTWKILRS